MLNIVSKPTCESESLFGLMFAEGLERMQAGRHGSQLQACWQEQDAKNLYLSVNMKQKNKKGK